MAFGRVSRLLFYFFMPFSLMQQLVLIFTLDMRQGFCAVQKQKFRGQRRILRWTVKIEAWTVFQNPKKIACYLTTSSLMSMKKYIRAWKILLKANLFLPWTQTKRTNVGL